MHFKTVLLLFFSAFIIMSCSSCKNTEGDKKTENLEKVTDPKFKLDEKNNLSPGSAKIRTSVSSINAEKEGMITVVVDGVLGYGSSTSVIGKSEIISIKVSEVKKEQILSLSKSVNLIIKQLPSGREMEESKIWKLISIEK